jgi:CDP-L-myo-inositol myo-inositolphosphotransferase
VDSQRIVDIGKNLKEYDYFDTGFFICKKEIFDYIDSDKKELSEVISELSKLGKAGYHLVDGLWIDVDTPDDVEVARKCLEDIIRKGDDGYISKHINRRISIKITEMLSRFEWIKPNHLTILSFSVGIISSLLFFTGNVLLGGITAQLCSIVDGCDGELARLKSLKTKFGGVLDCVSDRYVDVFIVLGMLWAYGLTDFSVFSFFLASTGSILLSYTWHQTDIRIRASSRDMRLFIIMVGGILAYVIGTIVMVYTMLIIGIITHAGVLAMLFKSRMNLSR